MKSVFVPESVTVIGDNALGYVYPSETDIPIEGFVIYGKSNTTAQTYAENNDITFVARNYKTGDCDGDEKITVNDVTTIQRHIAEFETLTGDRFSAADVNCDGYVTIDDASVIQGYLAEYIDIL